MSDRIEIRGLRVVCHVGVGAAERSLAQPIEIDLDLHLDLGPSAGSDDVGDTIDYGSVTISVADAVTERPVSLLERLASLAADAALGVDPRSTAVEVTVRKLRPPIPRDVVSTAVRLHRSRA